MTFEYQAWGNRELIERIKELEALLLEEKNKE